MVEDNEASPLALAAEQYATVNKYAGAFLQAFSFQSARRHDPLLSAISLLKRLHAERGLTGETKPSDSPAIKVNSTPRAHVLGTSETP